MAPNIKCFFASPWGGNNHPIVLRLSDALKFNGIEISMDNSFPTPDDDICAYINSKALKYDSNILLLIVSAEMLLNEKCKDKFELILKAERPVILILTESGSIPGWLSDIAYVDFRNTNFFEAALEELLNGIVRIMQMEEFIISLNNHDSFRRIEAAKSLGDSLYPRAVKAIGERLKKEPDPEVIYWFALALGKLSALQGAEGKNAQKILKTLKTMKSLRVRQGVLHALNHMRETD